MPEILSYLRDISAEPGILLGDSLDFRRTVNVGKIVRFDQDQLPTTFITVLTAEIAHPDQIIAEFFSAAGLDANRNNLRGTTSHSHPAPGIGRHDMNMLVASVFMLITK